MNYKNYSIWLDWNKKTSYPNVQTDITTDVLIIGGGITGLTTAYFLKNHNLKITLVEMNKISHGVSSKTTGKITYLQENILSKIYYYHGLTKANNYLKSQYDAIRIIKGIIENENIKCDFEKNKSIIIDNNSKKFDKEVNILKQLNVDFTIENDSQKKLWVDNTYVFHPIKYLYQLADICTKSKIDIYENSKVTKIDKYNEIYEVTCNNFKIRAKKIVIATHYPYFLFPTLLPFKSTTEKSYIKAYKTNNNYHFNSITISKPTISTRFWSDNKTVYKIVLGKAHNSSCKLNDLDNFYQLYSYANEKIDYLWSNNDIITNDALPYIGKIHKDEDIYIGTGYNTWGMTNGTLSGYLISKMILNQNNEYKQLFDPLRIFNVGNLLNFPIIIGSNVSSFLKSKIKKNKSWYKSNLKFEKRQGKNVAIYIDDNKKEHIVYNLCPHLKCSLIFNEIEKTWDCPCHGSRFDIDGKCIQGPSNYNITYKK